MIRSCCKWLRARHTGIATRCSGRRYLARGFPLSRGFTLVELVTVSAIAGIFLVLAIPALGSVADSMKLSSQSNVYLSSLHLARGEAIKRNSRVTVCKSANGVNCTSTGGWHQGWIIFHDANDDGIRNSVEPVIQQVQALPVRSRLTGMQALPTMFPLRREAEPGWFQALSKPER
jgi:prepilin-type N-terminal cleavage/methylation domain-containing protein